MGVLMASFAKIGLNGKVLAVHRLNDDVMQDANGNSTEALGVEFLTNLTGWAVWKQTSYNTFANEHKLGGTPFRKNLLQLVELTMKTEMHLLN